MGIRVNKVLGYGIADLNAKGDPRIDMKKFHDLLGKAYRMDSEKTIRWLNRQRRPLLDFYLRRRPMPRLKKNEQRQFIDGDLKLLVNAIRRTNGRPFDLADCIVHESEYGIPEVLLFIPVSCTRSWRRHDDTIDYYDETLQHKQESWYEIIKRGGIYPWDGGWVRFRDPKPGILKPDADLEKYAVIAPADYSQLVGWWDPKTPPLAEGDALKHFLEDYRPIMPLDLLCVLWYLRDAFTDVGAFVNDLRPMIYVYWS